jgi:hypothetical protein
MLTVTVDIKQKYFPAYNVLRPHKARISYEVYDNDKVGIMEIAMPPEALKQLGRNARSFVDDMQVILEQAVEDVKESRKAI